MSKQDACLCHSLTRLVAMVDLSKVAKCYAIMFYKYKLSIIGDLVYIFWLGSSSIWCKNVAINHGTLAWTMHLKVKSGLYFGNCLPCDYLNNDLLAIKEKVCKKKIPKKGHKQVNDCFKLDSILFKKKIGQFSL